MSVLVDSTTPLPDGAGPAARPAPAQRYRCRGALEVRARAFDGSRQAAEEITRWVAQLGHGCVGTTRAEREGWVVEVDDQRSDSCVELHPGEVLVWIRSSGRWVTCSAEQLGAWFEPAPRELPIYSDGEIAE